MTCEESKVLAKEKVQYDWAKPKPQPKVAVPKDHQLVRCNKCLGNGLYVMEVVNGQPWSSTGLECWSCGGKGWKLRKNRRQRCPKCGFLVHFEDGQPESHSFIRQVGDCFKEILCE